MASPASPAVSDLPRILGRGVSNFRRALVPHVVSAVVVLGIFGAGRSAAAAAFSNDDILTALLIDFAGLTLATIAALPWFQLALDAEEASDETPSLSAALDSSRGAFGAMTVAALFFWGGILLGLRYFVGIPSLFMLVWYGLFGFAVAAERRSGLQALGTSVRLGQGRRWVVAALALVLAILNSVAASPIGVEQTPVTVLIAAPLLIASTGVSMGAGAHLFKQLVATESEVEKT